MYIYISFSTYWKNVPRFLDVLDKMSAHALDFGSVKNTGNSFTVPKIKYVLENTRKHPKILENSSFFHTILHNWENWQIGK